MTIKFDIEEVRDYIRNSSDSSVIYIGADSERYKRHGLWYADYTVAVVIHLDGCRGCKVFGEVSTEADYDRKKNKPAIRLMNEVIKAAQMYLDLAEAVGDRKFQIHLDLNPDIMHGSSCVIDQAIGYIRGMCNVVPLVKPQSFAASYTADRLKEILESNEKRFGTK